MIERPFKRGHCHRIGAWSDERREKAAVAGRRRFGAPDGFATVYGVHVPLEHAEPLRFWAHWLSYNESPERASSFVEYHRLIDWSDVPRLRELWEERQQIADNREAIRLLTWEAIHAH